ncbi:MAG: AMP-binding protein [Cytophagales bacterium]
MAKTDFSIFTPEFGKLNIEDFVSLDLNTIPKHLQSSVLFLKFLRGNESDFRFKTSGSTGAPKELIFSRTNIFHSAKATLDFLNLKSSKFKSVLIALPTEKIAGAMLIARAYLLNFDLVLIKPSNIPLENEWLSMFEGFSLLSMVPHQFSLAFQSSIALSILQRCENILLGGSPVLLETVNKSKQLNANVFETFGMTETLSHIALKRLSPVAIDFFEALPGVEINSDSESRLLLKSAVTENQWILTDDRVKILNQNQFIWLGRSSNVINSGGVKIQAEEIERFIRSEIVEFQDVVFLILPMADELYGQVPGLLIEGVDNDLLVQKIKNLNFPKFQKPQKVFFVPEIPKTNFKIDRKSAELLIKKMI